MSHWSDNYVSIKGFTDDTSANGITIHYTRTGGDGLPIVLLHGLTDNGLCWTPVARELATEFDVIMPDARGHGLSSGPEGGFTMQHLIQDAVEALRTIGVEKFLLLGHSMGAHTAACIAADYPDMVQKLLLEDPPWTGTGAHPHPLHRKQQYLTWEDQLKDIQAHTLDERIVIGHEQHPHWSDEEIHYWALAAGQFKTEVFHKGFPSDEHNWLAVVPNIRCATLLITGEPAHGSIVTPEVARQAINMWPNGQLVHIEDAGHCIRRDQYSLFMNAVKKFLKEK